MKQYVGVKGPPRPIKLDGRKKESINNDVKPFIENSAKLSKSVNRFEVKAGRVYFYQLVEQFGWNNPEVKFTIPLIDGKYVEFHYARITLFPNECSLDWQRYNNQWMSLFTGTMKECLQFMEDGNEWFE